MLSNKIYDFYQTFYWRQKILYSVGDSGEFHAQRPVTRSFEIIFDLRLNKRLSKQ